MDSNNSKIENIKLSVDLLDLVQRGGLELRPAGKAFRGLCPFHSETTPSFFVWPESARWKCFGCQAGGDVFDFLQMSYGFTFTEALKFLTSEFNWSENIRYSSSGKLAHKKTAKELLLETEIEIAKELIKLIDELQDSFGKQLYVLFDALNSGELQPVDYFTQYHLFEYILAELDQDRLNQNRELKFLYRKRNRLYGLTRNKNGRVNENKLAA